MTEYYVDGTSGSDVTGDGSIGTPWQSVTYAYANMTHDAIYGTRLNVKNTSTLTADLNWYGTGVQRAPLVLQGYTSAAGDGGIGTLNCGGFKLGGNTLYNDYIIIKDMHFTNCGTSSNWFQADDSCTFENCEFENYDAGDTSPMIVLDDSSVVINCFFHNINSEAINMDQGIIKNNYFRDGTLDGDAHDFNTGNVSRHVVGPYQSSSTYTVVCEGNVFHLNNSCAIQTVQGWRVNGNTIVCVGGGIAGSAGIAPQNDWQYPDMIVGNYVEGYSASGAYGIRYSQRQYYYTRIRGNNKVFNCDTAFADVDGTPMVVIDGDAAVEASLLLDAAGRNYQAAVAGRDIGYPNRNVGDTDTDWGIDIGAVQQENLAQDLPAESDVRDGVEYDNGNETGTLDLPAVGDVQHGVEFDGASKTGTFVSPAEENVRKGIEYGNSAEFTGTLIVPTVSQVDSDSLIVMVVQRILNVLKAQNAITAILGEGDNIRAYGCHISTIVDWVAPAVSIQVLDANKSNDAAGYETIDLQIDVWYGGIGKQGVTWDDVLGLWANIKDALHQSSSLDYADGLNFSMYEMSNVGHGPQMYEEDTGILHYPTRWRVRAVK